MNIFTEVEENEKPTQGRGKEFWLKQAIEFRSLKEPITLKQFTSERGLKYSTATSAFSRLKEEIRAALKKVPLGKDFWIFKGVQFSQSNQTAKQFADEHDLVYSTFTSSMSRYKEDISKAIKVKELKKISPRKQTAAQLSLVMINDFRSGLRKRAAIGNVKNKSQKWFDEYISTAIRGHKVDKPEVGRLYTFSYDAKHKDTLPYWDKFPLIIYLGDGTTKNGIKLMYGLNLHYVAPKIRQLFLEELLKRMASTKTFTNKTRLKINWSAVKGMQGSDLMIKSYLPNHIKGTFVEIKPKDWVNAIFLPTQQFVSKGKKFSAQSVWAKY